MKRVKKGVFLVRKGSCTTFSRAKIRKIREKRGKIRQTWSMTKKRSSQIFAAKMGICSEKIVILVGEKNFRPPRLGARFPPMHRVMPNAAVRGCSCADLTRVLLAL